MNSNESPVRLLLGERAHVQVVHDGIDASGLAADGKATSHDFKKPIESALQDAAAHGHVGMLQLLLDHLLARTWTDGHRSILVRRGNLDFGTSVCKRDRRITMLATRLVHPAIPTSKYMLVM